MKVSIVIRLVVYFLISRIWRRFPFYWRPPRIETFFIRVLVNYALRNPELITYSGVLRGYGIRWADRRLTRTSDESLKSVLEQHRRDAAYLEKRLQGGLPAQHRESAEILQWYLLDQARRLPFLYHRYPITHYQGPQKDFPAFMMEIHPLHSAADARSWLRRMSKVKYKLADVAKALKTRKAMGMLPPRFTLELVCQEIGQLTHDGEHNILYNFFEENLPARTSKRRLKQARTLIRREVLPAYRQLQSAIQAVLPDAPVKAGLCEMPDGKSWYAQCLQSHTTLDLTAPEVHALGLREVALGVEEFQQAAAEIGEDGSLREVMQRLMADPKWYFSDDAAGRKDCLDYFASIITEMTTAVRPYFKSEASVPVEVRDASEAEIGSTRFAYYEPATYDGSRPGIFYVNLSMADMLPRFAMRTLACHEAIPGHHLQIARQMGAKHLPAFRRVLPFTAYVEGWALYAERLTREVGLMPDPYDNLGRIQAALLRATRLVVDTGIHHYGWSRDKAVTYMMDHTGLPEKELRLEVDRYAVVPAQACSYKIGELKILEARRKMKELRGDKFNLADFHEAILGMGSVPLSLFDPCFEAMCRRMDA